MDQDAGDFRARNIGFTTIDVNGDGVLGTGEIETAARSLLKLDKNIDGQITSDEVRLSTPTGRGRGGLGRGGDAVT